MSKHWMTLCFAVLLSITGLTAQVRMEGNFEGQLGAVHDASYFSWNMWDPNYNIETRFYANPVNNTEFYLKLYAEKYDRYGTLLNNTEAVMSEAHVKYRQEKNGMGFSAALFSRDQSFYWTDGSMMGFLNTGSVNGGGNGQGGRIDFWHKYNGSMTYVFSDFSGGQDDDIHLIRWRQSYLKNKLFTGIFYQRKNYGASTDRLQYNEIYATDIRYNFNQKYSLNAEIGCSSVPGEASIMDEARVYRNNGSFRDLLKSNVATQMEFKGFRVGQMNWGYWYMNPGFFNYGIDYRNYMGNNQSNSIGYYLNSYYIVPQRAITITMNYNYSQKQEKQLVHGLTEALDKNTSLYTEAYIEFINGFKGKFSYNMKDDWWKGEHYDHNDFFSELSVENRIAKLLAQFKIKDMGEASEKQIAGMETGFNLSKKWRLFVRRMMLYNGALASSSTFGELQYQPGNNTEMYIQYGPSGWGSYGLVNDDSFANNGKMVHEVKLIIKGWF